MAQSTQPNILLIVADQLAPQFSSPYGNAAAITPHLQRLAEDGVTFDAAYTSYPLCAPARHSLMSGSYVSRLGCYDNSSPMRSDQPTVAHYLTNVGYETILSGKMHFSGPDQLHGFARRLTTDIYPSDFSWLPDRPKEGWRGFSNVHASPIAADYVTAGPCANSLQLEYDEEVHFRAIEFLRGRAVDYGASGQRDEGRRSDAPFFLCVSYTHPHEPFRPPHDYWDRYENVEIDLPHAFEHGKPNEHPIDVVLNDYHGVGRVDLWSAETLKRLRRAYLAQITYIDDKVGDLLSALIQFGLEDETIVLFASDHGDMMGERGMIQKRAHYENSARIPLIIKDPSRVGMSATKRVQEPVSIVDLAPTVVQLAGAPEPEYVMDGSSLLPLVDGVRDPDRTVFCESHAAGMITTTFMARRASLKYIHATGHDSQLYDLSTDPHELHNLSGEAKYSRNEAFLRSAVFEKFDPDLIESQVESSIDRRRIVRSAMKRTGGPSWDFQPFVDASTSYWREG